MELMDMNRCEWLISYLMRRDASIYSGTWQEGIHLPSISKDCEAIPITLRNTDLPLQNFAFGSCDYSPKSSHRCIALISRMSIPALFSVGPLFAPLILFFSALIPQEHLQHCQIITSFHSPRNEKCDPELANPS